MLIVLHQKHARRINEGNRSYKWCKKPPSFLLVQVICPLI